MYQYLCSNSRTPQILASLKNEARLVVVVHSIIRWRRRWKTHQLLILGGLSAAQERHVYHRVDECALWQLQLVGDLSDASLHPERTKIAENELVASSVSN